MSKSVHLIFFVEFTHVIVFVQNKFNKIGEKNSAIDEAIAVCVSFHSNQISNNTYMLKRYQLKNSIKTHKINVTAFEYTTM